MMLRTRHMLKLREVEKGVFQNKNEKKFQKDLTNARKEKEIQNTRLFHNVILLNKTSYICQNRIMSVVNADPWVLQVVQMTNHSKYMKMSIVQ